MATSALMSLLMEQKMREPGIQSWVTRLLRLSVLLMSWLGKVVYIIIIVCNRCTSMGLRLKSNGFVQTTVILYDSCGETTILGTLYGAVERRTD
jgi:hypothetical protein